MSTHASSLRGLALSLALFAAGCAAAPPATATTSSVPVVPVLLNPAPTCSTATLPAGSTSDFVVRVEMLGTKRTKLKMLCDHIRTRAGSDLDEAMLASDVRELFNSGLMEDVLVASEISGEGRVVTFTVRERPLIKEWVVKCDGYAPTREHLIELFGKSGDLFDPASLRIHTAQLREEYVTAGFRAVEIDFRVTPAPDNEVVVASEGVSSASPTFTRSSKSASCRASATSPAPRRNASRSWA